MTKTVVTCDECGAERGAENHWFTLGVRDTVSYQAMLTVLPYIPDAFANQFDVCGRECAQKVFERWLDTGSVLKPEGDTR